MITPSKVISAFILTGLMLFTSITKLSAFNFHSYFNDLQQKYNSKSQRKSSTKIISNEFIIQIEPELLSNITDQKLTDQLDRLPKESIQIHSNSPKTKSIILHLVLKNPQEIKTLKEAVNNNAGVKITSNRIYKTQYTPNDSYYTSQENLDNIDFQTAIQYGNGTNDVLVAVIDDGIDIYSPEYIDRLWTNAIELNGINGVDDDSNGFVDDIYGCNFEKFNLGDPNSCHHDNLDNSNETLSLAHGSLVSSIIAANSNNGFGISGICPSCRLMTLDVSDNADGAYLSDIISAFNYLIEHDVDIINYSLASTCPFDESEDVLASYIQAASDNGSILVNAAGNNGNDTVIDCTYWCGSSNPYCYTSARHNVWYYIDGKSINSAVTIGATDYQNTRADFSNYNINTETVSVSAPGTNILALHNDIPYSISGTSFSTPQVSGSLGLFLSHNSTAFTPLQVKNHLIQYSHYINSDYSIGKLLNVQNLVSFTVEDNIIDGTGQQYVARFWSSTFQGHFYTPNKSEISWLIQNHTQNQWDYEGIAFYTASSNDPEALAMYRFWSDSYRGHFYTADVQEKDAVILNYPSYIWEYEGTTYKVYPKDYEGSSLPVYRFWSKTYHHHFYTKSESEKQNIIDSYPETVWKYEGIAFRIPTNLN